MVDDEVRGMSMAGTAAPAGATSASPPGARRHAALGMVFSDAAGPYFSEVITGFEAEALKAHTGLLIIGTHRLPELNDLVLDLSSRVDGIGILGRALPETLIQRIAERDVAMILMAHEPVDAIPAVRVDNFSPTLALTRHLIEHHRYAPVHFLGSPTETQDIAARWEGFCEAHRQCGLAPASPIPAPPDQIDGLRRTEELIVRGVLPRALVCANDELALGALSAARMHGVRVPADLALTGWDNIRMSDLVTPTLTTVHQPIEELGAVAARSLLAQIAGRAVARDTLLPTTNIYRGTCGCHGNA